jgi:hypothetical protein
MNRKILCHDNLSIKMLKIEKIRQPPSVSMVEKPLF